MKNKNDNLIKILEEERPNKGNINYRYIVSKTLLEFNIMGGDSLSIIESHSKDYNMIEFVDENNYENGLIIKDTEKDLESIYEMFFNHIFRNGINIDFHNKFRNKNK